MCAIAGIVHFSDDFPRRQTIIDMTDSMSYRGPDDRGYEVVGPCALGNRRLAIIDLSKRGHQPLWDRERRYCITYNGEIYNFKELRTRLQKRGYRFNSSSDTEVIVNVYKEYGIESLLKLEGMFALAIWDRQKNELVLARDRYGIKPLHYYFDQKVLVFASEIKAILRHPRVKKDLNTDALSHYFSLGFGGIASLESIYEGIYKLPPGHYAVVRDREVSTHAYYDVLKHIKPHQINEATAIRRIRALITDSVKRQLVSDVPLGIFLSGGIDSSLIAAIAQSHTKKKVQTFSIGFEDSMFDESHYARDVAQSIGSKHFHKTFTVRDLLDTLPLITEKLDEPLGDPSILPTYLLSSFARQHVTVALSGDGGDELFVGYPTYIAHSVSRAFNFLPKSLLQHVGNALSRLEILGQLPFLGHAPNLGVGYKVKRFTSGVHTDLGRQYIDFLGPMRLADKQKLLIQEGETALPFVHDLLTRAKNMDFLTKLQYLDMMIYMSEDCLVKVDRASSFNSLEVRVPFLDSKLAHYALSLPAEFKLRRMTLKYILKKAAHGYIPDHIIHRSKKGFGIPIDIWLRGELRHLVDTHLSTKVLKRQGLFHAPYVRNLIDEHMEKKEDHRMVLWNILMFQMWYERWYA